MNAWAREFDAVGRSRLHFLDNLRTFVVFLVILCHAGGVYESSGIWALFWIVDDPATNPQCGLVTLVLDIFMMPTLFFVSGYLAPASLTRRNGWAFLQAKSRRLLLPWAVGVLTLIPLYKAIFLYSRGLPQEAWTTYLHFNNGIFSQSWLWFLPVLFLFNVLYLLMAKARIRVPDVPVKLTVLVAFAVGFAYSVAMDVLGLQGWTKTSVLDFQNERLLIYFLVFLLGAQCFRRRVFDTKPKGRILYHAVNSLSWIPVMAYVVLLLYPWFKPGQFVVSETVHRLALWFSFHLSLLCLVYATVETFRRYLNRQGRVWRELNVNSYYVYVIHVIVMGALAMLLLQTAIPSLLKYTLLTVVTFVVSHAIVSVSRRASIALPARSAKPALMQEQLSRS